MIRLEIKKRKRTRIRTAHVEAVPFIIGRSSSCDLTLHHDSVSREHCVIESIDENFILRDIKSRHGLKLNHKEAKDAILSNGDVFRIGPYRITCHLEAKTTTHKRTLSIKPPVSSDEIKRIESLQHEIELIGQSLKERDSEIQTLTTTLEEEKQTAQKQIELLGHHLKEEQKKHQKEKEAVITIQIEIEDAQTKQLQSDLEIEELNNLVERERANCKVKSETADSLSKHIETLESQASQLTQELEQTKTHRQEAESRNQQLEEQLQDISSAKNEIEARADELKTQLHEIEGKSKQLQDQLEATSKINNELEAKVGGLEALLKESEKQLKNSAGQKEKLETEISELHDRITEDLSREKEAKSRIKELETILLQAQESWLEDDRVKVKTIRELKEDIEVAKLALKETEKQSILAINNRDEFKRRNQTLMDSQSRLTDKCKLLMAQLNTARRDLEAMRKIPKRTSKELSSALNYDNFDTEVEEATVIELTPAELAAAKAAGAKIIELEIPAG